MSEQDSSSKDRDAAEYLMQLVEEMRYRQRRYVTSRMLHDGNEAIKLEAKVDATIAKLKARGYNGSRFKDNTQQSKLF